jgi:hypothetical protein
MEKLNHIAMKKSEAVRRVASLEDHRSLLKEVFQTAQERVLIVSPFVSKSALHADCIPAHVQSAISRGVVVQVYTDNDLNRVDGDLKRSANEGIAELLRAGATVIVLDGIHNKTLIRDNDLITEGSFNWLSAVRTYGGTHQREERTIVVEGDEAKGMIEDEIKGLRSKRGGVARIRSSVPEAVPASARKPTVPSRFDSASTHSSKFAQGLAWTAVVVAVILFIRGLFKSTGEMVAAMGGLAFVGFVFGSPIYLFAKYIRQPFPKSSKSVFTDKELGISDIPKKKKEEFGGDYSITGPDNNAIHLFNPDRLDGGGDL